MLKWMTGLALLAIAMVCSTQTVEAQDFSRYRNFVLRSDLATVSALAAVAPSTAKTVHERPAVLQDLEWRPSRWTAGSSEPSADPVERVVFSFYNDQLFQIVVDYGERRTEGMSAADMTEGIVAEYGPALLQTSRSSRAASRLELQSGPVLARWGDGESSIALFRTSGYGVSYRLVVADVRLADLARAAETQALRMDEQEAPQREIARQKKEQDDGRAAADKARATNRGTFRP